MKNINLEMVSWIDEQGNKKVALTGKNFQKKKEIEEMNYKKMWYQLKKEMLKPMNRHVIAEHLVRTMDCIEVNEAVGEHEIKRKDNHSFQIIMPDNVPGEIKQEIEKIARNMFKDI